MRSTVRACSVVALERWHLTYEFSLLQRTCYCPPSSHSKESLRLLTSELLIKKEGNTPCFANTFTNFPLFLDLKMMALCALVSCMKEHFVSMATLISVVSGDRNVQSQTS